MKSMTSMRIGNVYVYDTDAFSQREKDFCSKVYSVIYFADLFCKNGVSKIYSSAEFVFDLDHQPNANQKMASEFR